jgi:signal transduction histidine kinase
MRSFLEGPRELARARLGSAGLLAAAVALVLLAAGELALEKTLALEQADPRLKRAVGQQRMLTERIAQTALRLSAAEREERADLARTLEAAVELWALNHAAFRSVDAGPEQKPMLPVMGVPEWADLDALQAQLQRSALVLVSEARAPGTDPDLATRRAAGIREEAVGFERLVDRWLRSLEREHADRQARYRTARRACVGGAALAMLLAFALPSGTGRSRRSLREEERRRALQERLHAAERLESLAPMAAGVAHDFNNLIGVIIANAELAEAADSQREREVSVGEILAAARAASELVRALLACAGEGELELDEVDLGATVAEAVRLLLPRTPAGVMLRLDDARDVPPVRGDRAQLRQIAMNLISNAMEAIGDVPGRVDVRVRADHVYQAFLDASHHGDDVATGPCAMLEVEDTGVGMDAATRARVSDPCYSTKFADRGLGLAAVLGIVRRHHGAIAVETEPSRGSRFLMALPLARDPEQGQKAGG